MLRPVPSPGGELAFFVLAILSQKATMTMETYVDSLRMFDA